MPYMIQIALVDEGNITEPQRQTLVADMAKNLEFIYGGAEAATAAAADALIDAAREQRTQLGTLQPGPFMDAFSKAEQLTFMRHGRPLGARFGIGLSEQAQH